MTVKQTKVVALAGNPNVGKSTIFNNLTGMKQHTGNWPGKTVARAEGTCHSREYTYTLVDIPGTCSLAAHSPEEEVAREYLCQGHPDAVVAVCDATCLERSLNLALQILELTPNVVICVNLMDEAEKRSLHIDLALLSRLLGLPVCGVSACDPKTLTPLLAVLDEAVSHPRTAPSPALSEILKQDPEALLPEKQEQRSAARIAAAEALARQTVTGFSGSSFRLDRKLDRILTGRLTGYPVMLLFLALILWLTITGANYPSRLLFALLFRIQDGLTFLFSLFHAPDWLHGALILGVYQVSAWVVSVMLPPMAIFFPLFTLLEDAGYLPRIAYNLDRPFRCCRACGKQALTLCMGLGCNAVGVTGCRIIDSPRERLLAILTNCFVPCNGKFPTLTALSAMFFAGAAVGPLASFSSALFLTAVLALGLGMTLIMTKLLSVTVLKGVPSSFTLELPPYRKPQFRTVLLRSLLDRTLFVLGRAVVVAAPAGLLIWLLANCSLEGTSLLNRLAAFFDPFARLMGLDGTILLAFILGFPANEIVLPIILMAYLAQGVIIPADNLPQIHELLVLHGWTWKTAACAILFSLMHWPCSTTLLTIRKETGSLKWTLLAALLPTAAGILACMLFTWLFG